MNPAEKIRVLLVDDHRLLRDALKAVLKNECEIVGEAADGESAATLAVRTRPHVVVLDVRMPGIGGLAAAHRIAEASPASKVLILSQYDDEEYVIEALGEANAAGYLLKTDAAEELVLAIRAVHAGKRYLSPSIAPIVLARLKPHPGRAPGKSLLTKREREVLRMIADGATTKEIAAKLAISPKTAQIHRDNLKQKLGLHTTAAIVRYAIQNKLVRLD